MDDFTSSTSSMSDGVPQGSVISLLLFLLIINKVPNFSLLFKFILFADDSTLSTSFVEENAHELTLTYNRELNCVNNCLTFDQILY